MILSLVIRVIVYSCSLVKSFVLTYLWLTLIRAYALPQDNPKYIKSFRNPIIHLR